MEFDEEKIENNVVPCISNVKKSLEDAQNLLNKLDIPDFSYSTLLKDDIADFNGIIDDVAKLKTTIEKMAEKMNVAEDENLSVIDNILYGGSWGGESGDDDDEEEEDQGFFSKVANKVSDAAETVGDFVVNTAENIGDAVGDAIDTVDDYISDKSITEVAGDIISDTGEFISDKAEDFGDAILDGFETIGEFVTDTATDVGDAILETGSDILQNCTELIEDIKVDLYDFGIDIKETAYDVGCKIVDVAEDVGDFVLDVGSEILATGGMVVTKLGMGIFKFVTYVGEALVILGTAVDTIGTAIYDIATGDDWQMTKGLWATTMDINTSISEWTEGVEDSFYYDTAVGTWISDNSLIEEDGIVSNIVEGIATVIPAIVLTVLTGGSAGVALGATVSATATLGRVTTESWEEDKANSREGIEEAHENGEISDEEYNAIQQIWNMTDEEWDLIVQQYNEGSIDEETYEIYEYYRNMDEDWKTLENARTGVAKGAAYGAIDAATWLIGSGSYSVAGKVSAKVGSKVGSTVTRLAVDTTINGVTQVAQDFAYVGINALSDGDGYGEAFEEYGGWKQVLMDAGFASIMTLGGDAFENVVSSSKYKASNTDNTSSNVEAFNNLTETSPSTSTNKWKSKKLDKSTKKYIEDCVEKLKNQTNDVTNTLMKLSNYYDDYICTYGWQAHKGFFDEFSKELIKNNFDKTNVCAYLNTVSDSVVNRYGFVKVETYNGIDIKFQSDPNYSNTTNGIYLKYGNSVIDNIHNCLDKIPDPVKAYVSEINVYQSTNALDGYWCLQYNYSNFISEATGGYSNGAGQINIYTKDSASCAATIAHEAGHTLDGGIVNSSNYISERRLLGKSGYCRWISEELQVTLNKQ